MPERSPRYRLSRYAHVVQVRPDVVAIANGPLLRRTFLSGSLARVPRLFERPLSEAEFDASFDDEVPKASIANLLRTLLDEGFIVPEEYDEEAAMREALESVTPASEGMRADRLGWDLPAPRSWDSFSHLPDPRRVKVLLLGGCLVLTTAATLRAIAASYGFSVDVVSLWPTQIDSIRSVAPDVVVFQPFIVQHIGRIWDAWAFIDDGERVRRVEDFKALLTSQLVRLVEYARGRCVLVHGVSSPQHPPHGRADFRLSFSFARMVAELNEHVRQRVRDHGNMLFIDEERIVSNFGKRALMDDMVEAYGHHGGLDTLDYQNTLPPSGPTKDTTRANRYEVRPGTLSELLAREYLDAYALFLGLGALKCVVVDLDNTLWRGIVGEGAPPTVVDHHPGIHQALRILKQRGILLATCSKNNHDDVMSFWRGLARRAEGADDPGADRLLSPDDFVVHSINWAPKSENIGKIASQLGLSLEAILFVDDSPIEREEVRHALAGIRVFDDDMWRVREALLADRRLQVNMTTDEGGTRTALVRSQLERDASAAAATDPREFLRSLRIRIAIRRASEASIPRIVELCQRTSQFNTTQVRYDAGMLRGLLDSPRGEAYVCEVTDRFGDYGLVGVLVLRDDHVENVVISCRVLALEIAVPFVVGVLQHAGGREWIGTIVPTERNHPCRAVFADCGFAPTEDGAFVGKLDALTSIQRDIHEVTLQAEVGAGGGRP